MTFCLFSDDASKTKNPMSIATVAMVTSYRAER